MYTFILNDVMFEHPQRADADTQVSSESLRDPVSGPPDVRAYINEQGVSVPHGSLAIDAVRAIAPGQADAIVAGTMRLTDSRGLPVSAELPLVGGSIFRVVPVRERLEDAS